VRTARRFVFVVGLLVVSCWLSVGCTVTHVSKAADSFSVIRKSWFTRQMIGEIRVELGTNVLTIRGYNNDQVEALGILTEAAVKGAVEAAKP